MENEMKEYSTFHITASDGRDVEMAVVDEFDIEKKHYVVGAVVEDDTIAGDGRYIYGCVIKGDGFEVRKIENEREYEMIANAYMEME